MLEVVRYPHPTLRHKSKPLQRVDGELVKIVDEMFDLMYRERGVGLAANQVDLPYRFFILNLEADPEKGKPFVFINPVISRRSGTVEAEEGCLSFPEIFAPVRRSERVVISAYDLAGEEVTYQLDGFFARAVQHECDHLDGVLLIDRLSPSVLLSIKDSLAELELDFSGSARSRGRAGRLADSGPPGRVGGVEDIDAHCNVGDRPVRRADLSHAVGERPRRCGAGDRPGAFSSGQAPSRRSATSGSWPSVSACPYWTPRT